MESSAFNDKFRQVVLFGIIIVIALLLFFQLTAFLPGLLGGFTIYVLSRSIYFKLTEQKKWKKGAAALLLMFLFLVLIALPVYAGFLMLSPKINQLASQQDKIINGIQVVAAEIKNKTGLDLFTAQNIKSISAQLSVVIPMLLNGTASLFMNLLMMFFIYYYLLVNGRRTEQFMTSIIPLKKENVDLIAEDTKMMVRANALGIPLICFIQGLTAALGYWIFGVEDWGLWAFFTGLFAFFPLVGTMIVWVPLVLYLFATGEVTSATWLTFYSFIITGNVDYLARMTLMKRMGDVHPLITVIGVIAGLNLFGFMGLVFGPLLVSYFIILVKIYISEFSERKNKQNISA
jgi:predicted PurR-regulated permease PerM